MKTPRLWIFDIDGTCNHQVYKILEGFKTAGRLCTFATGRGYLRTIEALDGFQPNAPLILEDGGRLTTNLGVDIRLKSFATAELTDIKTALQTQTGQIDFITFCPKASQKYIFLILTPAGQARLKQLELIRGSVTPDLETFFNLAESLGCSLLVTKTQAGSEIILPPQISFTIAKGMYNINPQGVNKNTGVIDLVKILGLSLADVAVIGNDGNDLPMFQLPVGVKIAVGDHIALKRLATHCVSSPDQLAELLKDL